MGLYNTGTKITIAVLYGYVILQNSLHILLSCFIGIHLSQRHSFRCMVIGECRVIPVFVYTKRTLSVFWQRYQLLKENTLFVVYHHCI